MDAFNLLVWLLVVILVAGIAYYVAALLLPSPLPTLLALVVIVIALVALLGERGRLR